MGMTLRLIGCKPCTITQGAACSSLVSYPDVQPSVSVHLLINFVPSVLHPTGLSLHQDFSFTFECKFKSVTAIDNIVGFNMPTKVENVVFLEVHAIDEFIERTSHHYGVLA